MVLNYLTAKPNVVKPLKPSPRHHSNPFEWRGASTRPPVVWKRIVQPEAFCYGMAILVSHTRGYVWWSPPCKQFACSSFRFCVMIWGLEVLFLCFQLMWTLHFPYSRSMIKSICILCNFLDVSFLRVSLSSCFFFRYDLESKWKGIFDSCSILPIGD